MKLQCANMWIYFLQDFIFFICSTMPLVYLKFNISDTYIKWKILVIDIDVFVSTLEK